MTVRAAAVRPFFPPLDHALIQALACEVMAEMEQPLSRQSLADLTERAKQTLGKKVSRSTVWRVLHEAAIKPWQYDHWLFPRDPAFAKKAGPILDLYAGRWEDQALGPKDFVLSSDEKTSIQARQRRHGETPAKPHRRRRIESEYKRKGALQYLAAWDVTRGMVLGRCEAKTGIEPFGRLVDQILEQEPYTEAERLFLIVDNGSSHRGQASVQRLQSRDRRITLLHTPIHGSWLNQIEIYFSIIQKEGTDTQRFRGPGYAPDSSTALRGIDEPQAEAVRVEVHSSRNGRVAKTGLAAFSSRKGGLSRRPVQPRRHL